MLFQDVSEVTYQRDRVAEFHLHDPMHFPKNHVHARLSESEILRAEQKP